jgi:uncharacterized protein (DUF1800 family)
MAKVFTGWSWACPDWPDNSCFSQGAANGNSDPDRSFKAMLGYAQYHSTEAKSFLGTTIPAQSLGDPTASLRVALDTLANHANVGPFIGRQLIQRLVTSNPSPAYVRAVSQAWANNGSGVRGDMKAVVKAVLMHPEARRVSDSSGKVREPVLKLAAYLRAFPHSSDTGFWRVGNTDNPATSLGQTPLRSPSVFNFYRPGYMAPGTAAAAANLVAPELQIAHETSVAAWVNFMRDNVASGVGQNNGTVNGVALNRRDIRPDFSAEIALANDARRAGGACGREAHLGPGRHGAEGRDRHRGGHHRHPGAEHRRHQPGGHRHRAPQPRQCRHPAGAGSARVPDPALSAEDPKP